MAASREQRRNAGNRMSRALDEEITEDDFYKTTYGGFAEVDFFIYLNVSKHIASRIFT